MSGLFFKRITNLLLLDNDTFENTTIAVQLMKVPLTNKLEVSGNIYSNYVT